VLVLEGLVGHAAATRSRAGNTEKPSDGLGQVLNLVVVQGAFLDLHAAAVAGDCTKVKRWIVDRGSAVDARKDVLVEP
jgi:hypothetical protein